MYKGVAEVIDGGGAESQLEHFVVTLQGRRPGLREMSDGLRPEMRDAVFRGHAQDTGDVKKIVDATVLQVPGFL